MNKYRFAFVKKIYNISHSFMFSIYVFMQLMVLETYYVDNDIMFKLVMILSI